VDHLNHIWELDCPDIENLEDLKKKRSQEDAKEEKSEDSGED